MKRPADLERYLRTTDGKRVTRAHARALRSLRLLLGKPLTPRAYRNLRAVFVKHDRA